MPPEMKTPKSPPVWVFVLLYLVTEGSALLLTLSSWPGGEPLASQKFVLDAVVAPLLVWVAISIAVYHALYGGFVYEAAVKNSERWRLVTRWKEQSRAGIALLDSVILTPEPDLAERMLSLEGSPPENPGKVMALDSVDVADGVSRVRGVLDRLLTPMAAKLTQAARSDSFEIVMQCERQEMSADVQAVWSELKLPGRPRIRWMDNDREVGFADNWFKEDSHTSYSFSSFHQTPRYRLLLAWHLNEGGAEVPQTASEAAVALLLGSTALMQEKPDTKHQAWLLRQIVGEADQVDRSLALLLRAEQAPPERIRHFWHSRLKGLAQHTTVGAVRDTDLKVEEHALDPAIGPQAPVVRWLLPALAAKMAHFGQGAQLVALPHEKGVALNLVVKAHTPADMPWKPEYGYSLIAFEEICMCMTVVTLALLVSDNKAWGTFETVVVVLGVIFSLLFVGAKIFMRRVYADNFWREHG
jgi:hypothetical protein